MSADFHLHIFEGLTEEDLKVFFSNTMGSKYFDPSIRDDDDIVKKVAKAPNIWIGQVSWLKAAFLGDDEHYIPLTVEKIQEIIGEDLPVIDDKLTMEIIEALSLENKTQYEIAKKENVRIFLEGNKGKRIFTVSW